MSDEQPFLGQTRVDRLIVVQLIESKSSRGSQLVLDQPTTLPTGAIITSVGSDLVVQHPDGRTTRHPGRWDNDPRLGDTRPRFVIGQSVE